MRTAWWALGALAAAGAVSVAVLALTDEPSGRPPDEAAPATTSGRPIPSIDAFIVSFRVAIDTHDTAFLLDHLHRAVLEVYGEEACRGFVERDILSLENYRQTGPAVGPVLRALGQSAVQTYEVPVAFSIGDQEYDDVALFGLEGDSMAWFGQCS